MKYQYSEDLFADTRMTFGEHLEDLRVHLWRAIAGFVIGLFVSFFIGGYVVEFIKQPVEEALLDYHIAYYKKNPEQTNRLVERLGQELSKEDVDPTLRQFLEPTQMPVTVAPAALDDSIRRLYPQLFAEGGALHDAAKPPADAAPVALTLGIKPSDFLQQFQSPLNLLAKRSLLTTLSAQEAFLVYFKVCILTGFIIASPWVFYQVWHFVAAGLYPHEKKYVRYYLPFSLALFLGGVALCQFAVIPAALDALLHFNLLLNIEPDFRLNEWLGFAILMPVVFGLSFQTPIVMLFLEKIGIFTAEDYASKRRMAIFVMTIFAAFVTPSVDVISMLLLAAPMVGLYELGIILARRSRKRVDLEDLEVPYAPQAAASRNDEYSSQGTS